MLVLTACGGGAVTGDPAGSLSDLTVTETVDPTAPASDPTVTETEDDTETVELTVDAEDGLVVVESPLQVAGTATPGALVTVGGRDGGVLVDASGAWDLVIELAEGRNDLRFHATMDGVDPAAVDLAIKLDPQAFPPEFSP